MKKFILFTILFATILCMLIGCSQEKNDIDSLLLSKGLEFTAQMDKMAESKVYRQCMLASEELNNIIKEIGNADYTTPKFVYKVSIPEGVAFSSLTGHSFDELPNELQTITEDKFLAAIPMKINGRNGADVLSATACVATGGSFLCEELAENSIFIFIFDTGYSSMVSFSSQQDGIVRASANFVKADFLTDFSSEQELTKWIEENLFSIKEITIKQISLS